MYLRFIYRNKRCQDYIDENRRKVTAKLKSRYAKETFVDLLTSHCRSQRTGGRFRRIVGSTGGPGITPGSREHRTGIDRGPIIAGASLTGIPASRSADLRACQFNRYVRASTVEKTPLVRQGREAEVRSPTTRSFPATSVSGPRDCRDILELIVRSDDNHH